TGSDHWKRLMLVARLRWNCALLSAGALWRWRDVFLRRRGPGCLGVPLAQYLGPIVGLPSESAAGRSSGRSDRQPMGRDHHLRSYILYRPADWIDFDVFC